MAYDSTTETKLTYWDWVAIIWHTLIAISRCGTTKFETWTVATVSHSYSILNCSTHKWDQSHFQKSSSPAYVWNETHCGFAVLPLPSAAVASWLDSSGCCSHQLHPWMMLVHLCNHNGVIPRLPTSLLLLFVQRVGYKATIMVGRGFPWGGSSILSNYL